MGAHILYYPFFCTFDVFSIDGGGVRSNVRRVGDFDTDGERGGNGEMRRFGGVGGADEARRDDGLR